MIPPLFMDIEPHHRILDMCAAPGDPPCCQTGEPAPAVHFRKAAAASLSGAVPSCATRGHRSCNT